MSRHLSNSSQEEEDSFSSIELEQAIINDSQGGQSEEEWRLGAGSLSLHLLFQLLIGVLLSSSQK